MDGTVEIRESIHRVTGTQQFVDDMPINNVLHGALVRLDVAHGRINGVDPSRALSLSGVEQVISAADLPRPTPRYGPLVMDQPILAVEETRFWGDPVAIVLARDVKSAREGARRVRVDYEELPAVLTAEDALAADAPLVQDPALRPDSPLANTNIMSEFPLSWGSMDGVEERCALILENEYRTPFAHHFAMELYGCLAVPEDGGVTIVTAVQHPFVLRKVIATMLDLPHSSVRVRATEAGGGFGGRGYPKMECLAAYLAVHLNRSIKLSMTGEEGFMLAQREAARTRIRTGFTAAGKLVFQDIQTDLLVGAYADIAPRVVGKAGIMAAGTYVVPNARLLARGLFTHTTPTTAFRGFGATHAGFAVEGQMNEAAEKLEIDPVEIRLLNMPEKGQEFIPGDTPADGDWKEALRTLAKAMDWYGPRKPGTGRGIAIGSKNSIPASVSFARVRLNADGSVVAFVGSTEMGQGLRSTMPKIVARALEIPLERVQLVQGDTAVVPFDFGTAGSRSTVTMGSAVLDACEKLKGQLRELAVRNLGCDETEVEFTRGGIQAAGSWKSYADLLAIEYGPGLGDIEAEGVFRGPRDPSHPLGGPTPFYEFLITGIELSVDEETGEHRIHTLYNVTDVGYVINPQRAAGVDEGAAVMGLGLATMEQVILDDAGRIRNPSSLDYRIPTIADVPERMVTLFQENGDGPGPFGSKGMGEGAVLATAPALAEAFWNCTGVRFRELPFTPERVWRGVRETKS
jgi:CO/xanthine dehydrogenase Mo-binding subunit